MAKKNLDHAFLEDGRRVTMDKRDGSVILSNDHDGCYYDGVIFNGKRIGYMERAATGWTAKALDGTTRSLGTRSDAIDWLMSTTDTSPVHMPTIGEALQEAFESLPTHVRGIMEGDLTAQAMYIARVVRDAMEDFHVAHLSDVQMAELNPLIRQGILDALVIMARANDHRDPLALAAISAMTLQGPPSYWEVPDPDHAVSQLATISQLGRQHARRRR
jgi:hypothetical protein